MRININNQDTIDKIIGLCSELDVKNPTQLIYMLIEEKVLFVENAQGCKDYAKKERINKNGSSI